MTTLASSSRLSETALKKQLNLFYELVPHLGNAFLNRIFDLRPAKAARRRRYLFILFFVSGFLISLRIYPLVLWTKFVRDILSYSLNPAYAVNYVGNPYTNFLAFVNQVFRDPRILQYIPIFLASFFIALQCAALYLADIFEQEDVSVARKFVWRVALSGSQETIRVSQGNISDEHRYSPTFLIGGPGKVIVDLDSVAVFEKPDGTPHIIGPTGKESGGKAILEGFERFRRAIDLRDHFIELREIDGKSSVVKSRSLDGIPITATHVQFLFSVDRNGQKPSTEVPYPFSQKGVERLVYGATSKVTPDLINPSTFEFSWINNMVSLIRGRLGGFMSDHNLTEYLASIGKPEFDKSRQNEEKINAQERKLDPSELEDRPPRKEIKPPPDFTPRYKITDLFTQFAEEYSKSISDRGVELRWIGVGTWKPPIEIIPETKIVPEKHLDAWKLSRENLARGSIGAMEAFKNEAILLHMMTLIQDVPVSAYQKAIEEQKEYKNATRELLLSYRQQLINAKNFILAKGEVVPAEIENAIKNINNGFGTWIGGG
jgi:hypothetical protein